MALGIRRLRRIASQLRSHVQSQPCHLDPETWSELLEISTVNPSAARIWRLDSYSGANCSKQWVAASDAGSADLVLHVRLCWLRLKIFADNTCWVKCTPGSNKSICNPLATQGLSPNVPNIIFTVSERDRGQEWVYIFPCSKISLSAFCLGEKITFTDILDLRVCNKIEWHFNFPTSSNYLRISCQTLILER